MTAMLAYVGYGRFLLLALLLLLFFGIPILFFDIFLGTFTGTGISWSTRNAVPITAGAGVAIMVQTLLLVYEEIAALSGTAVGSVAALSIRNECSADYIFNSSECTTPANITSFCQFQFDGCKNGFQQKSHMQYIEYRRLSEPGFDFFVLFGLAACSLVVALVSMVSIRWLSKYGKFFVIPTFVLLYVLLFVTGLLVRKKSEFGVLMSFSHISDFGDDVTMKEVVNLCFKYFFDFFFIGQGVVSALSRRAQIPGKS